MISLKEIYTFRESNVLGINCWFIGFGSTFAAIDLVLHLFLLSRMVSVKEILIYKMVYLAFRRPEAKRRRREQQEEEQRREQQRWQDYYYPPVNAEPVPQMPPVMDVNPPMEAPIYAPQPPNIFPTTPPMQIVPVIYANIPKSTPVAKPKPRVKTSYMIVRDNRIAPITPKWSPYNGPMIMRSGPPYFSGPIVPQRLSESHPAAPPPNESQS